MLRLLFRLFFYHKCILYNDTDSDESFMVFLSIFDDFPKILNKVKGYSKESQNHVWDARRILVDISEIESPRPNLTFTQAGHSIPWVMYDNFCKRVSSQK